MIDVEDTRPSDGGHLTPAQVRAIETYMRKLLAALELNYWRVYVATDLPPPGALLMIEPTDGRRIAMLYVSEDWYAKQDATEKRINMTHEALHLAHHDQELVIRHFKDTTGDVATYPMQIIWDQFKVETERMVDSLSYVLAPHMPAWREPRA